MHERTPEAKRTINCYSHSQLLACTSRHGRNVGDQEQKHFSPLGTKLHFHVYTTVLHEKFLQFDWLRAVVFQLNLKYLHVKIINLL